MSRDSQILVVQMVETGLPGVWCPHESVLAMCAGRELAGLRSMCRPYSTALKTAFGSNFFLPQAVPLTLGPHATGGGRPRAQLSSILSSHMHSFSSIPVISPVPYIQFQCLRKSGALLKRVGA